MYGADSNWRGLELARTRTGGEGRTEYELKHTVCICDPSFAESQGAFSPFSTLYSTGSVILSFDSTSLWYQWGGCQRNGRCRGDSLPGRGGNGTNGTSGTTGATGKAPRIPDRVRCASALPASAPTWSRLCKNARAFKAHRSVGVGWWCRGWRDGGGGGALTPPVPLPVPLAPLAPLPLAPPVFSSRVTPTPTPPTPPPPPPLEFLDTMRSPLTLPLGWGTPSCCIE